MKSKLLPWGGKALLLWYLSDRSHSLPRSLAAVLESHGLLRISTQTEPIPLRRPLFLRWLLLRIRFSASSPDFLLVIVQIATYMSPPRKLFPDSSTHLILFIYFYCSLKWHYLPWQVYHLVLYKNIIFLRTRSLTQQCVPNAENKA